MNDKKIFWGIIGCGDVTEQKSGPAFNKIKDSKLLAVMRRNADKAADYAHRHQVEFWYSDADSLLSNPLVNAIYIATPPSSHLEYAIRALKLGKAVYVEKPVTINAREATLLGKAVHQYNGKLVVAHYRRKLPMFLKIKKMIDEGVIGAIRIVTLRLWQNRTHALATKEEVGWRTNAEISGGGYFLDLSPHQLDLMLYFFGPPLSYSGFSQIQVSNQQVADQTTGTILFDNKILFNGSWCFNVDKQDEIDCCEIIGDSGSLRFSIFGNKLIIKNENGEQEFSFTHPENIEYPMIRSAVNYFLDSESNPSSIEEAIILMKIIDNFAKVI